MKNSILTLSSKTEENNNLTILNLNKILKRKLNYIDRMVNYTYT